MTTWFVSRHPGAIEWATRQTLAVDEFVHHLDPALVRGGDTVMGSLPVNLAAAVCERGARYLHLSMELPPDLRGKELTADQLDQLGAKMCEYRLERSESELTTSDEAPAYDRWFGAQVQASLDDPRPSVPHDQMMAELDQIIAQADRQLQLKNP